MSFAAPTTKLAHVRVHVLYFAILRERVRAERETVELPDGAVVADARALIAARHPELAGLLPQVQSAVNRSFAGERQALAEGDELALIPPVAGGSGAAREGDGTRANSSASPRKVAVVPEALDLGAVVACVEGPGRGGLVTFSGVVRRQGHRLSDVVRLEYEAYVEMAEQVLAEIVQEIEREWPGTCVAVHHRVGSLGVGEAAVMIAAAAPHRAEAFDACRATIDRLKQRAPIWKKEIGEAGEVWLGLGP